MDEDDEKEAQDRAPWHERARIEWSIRRGTTSGQDILMRRHCDEHGKDHNDNEVGWTDIATIYSYNDTEQILRALRGVE